MLNHGLVVVPLFLIIGVLARGRGGSESLSELGGMAMRAPVLAALFLIVGACHAGHARARATSSARS